MSHRNEIDILKSPLVFRRSLLKTAGAILACAASRPLQVSADEDTPEMQAQKFLRDFQKAWLPLDTASAEAQWVSETDSSEIHSQERLTRESALNEFLGTKELVERAKQLLEKSADLEKLTIRQLEALLRLIASAPGTIPETVKMKNVVQSRQDEILNGFEYTLESNGTREPIKINEIDRQLFSNDSLPVRRVLWESSKAIGKDLRSGLLYLRDLRNRIAKEMGYGSFFDLQVAEYGMTGSEMIELTEGFVKDNQPLYEQLHTWAKFELATKYQVKEAELTQGPIPAHWLPNRWGQSWPGLVSSINMDGPFAGKPKEFVIQQAEAFYVSIGFPKLPDAFHTKSDLYPSTNERKKSSNAYTYHIDWDKDVRCLMSIEPNARWFTIAHHELGHVYYMNGYSVPEVPILLRSGANRAFHEGIGDLIGFASSQPKYLKSIGLLPSGSPNEGSVEWLLEPALTQNTVVFLPFAAGTMTRFEKAFYAGEIPDTSLNTAWWAYARRYQGIVPPGERSETFCDAATKAHINNDPAQYYDYALGTIIKFQLHDHICREILRQEPQNCNYFGNKKVGEFLANLFKLGATRDWREVLKEAIGTDLSAKPMVAYFAPLLEWLKEKNKGRSVGW